VFVVAIGWIALSVVIFIIEGRHAQFLFSRDSDYKIGAAY